MNKPKVLFLCTGNSARSQMAEAFLRKYANSHFEAYSAGIQPKGLNPMTIAVMKEIGIDLAGQTSKDLNTYLGKINFEYLVTVCDDADRNCPVGPASVKKRMHWSFEDPATFEGTYEEKLDKFRDVRDQIGDKIKHWLAEQNIFIQQTTLSK